jgi:hypothetical protein
VSLVPIRVTRLSDRRRQGTSSSLVRLWTESRGHPAVRQCGVCFVPNNSNGEPIPFLWHRSCKRDSQIHLSMRATSASLIIDASLQSQSVSSAGDSGAAVSSRSPLRTSLSVLRPPTKISRVTVLSSSTENIQVSSWDLSGSLRRVEGERIVVRWWRSYSFRLFSPSWFDCPRPLVILSLTHSRLAGGGPSAPRGRQRAQRRRGGAGGARGGKHAPRPLQGRGRKAVWI